MAPKAQKTFLVCAGGAKQNTETPKLRKLPDEILTLKLGKAKPKNKKFHPGAGKNFRFLKMVGDFLRN